METLKLKPGTNALVVVAHPDDETIWMGGTILANPDVNWTIWSMCRAGDSDRMPKFKRVCAQYNAKSIISDLDDEDKLNFRASIKEALKILKNNFPKRKRFDYIFTHGDNGEYGHVRHRTVHKAMLKLMQSRKYQPKEQFLFFNYKKNDANGYDMVCKKRSTYLYKLPNKLFKKKQWIVSVLHGYPMEGIDVGLCTNPEAFLLKPIKVKTDS